MKKLIKYINHCLEIYEKLIDSYVGLYTTLDFIQDFSSSTTLIDNIFIFSRNESSQLPL